MVTNNTTLLRTSIPIQQEILTLGGIRMPWKLEVVPPFPLAKISKDESYVKIGKKIIEQGEYTLRGGENIELLLTIKNIGDDGRIWGVIYDYVSGLPIWIEEREKSHGGMITSDIIRLKATRPLEIEFWAGNATRISLLELGVPPYFVRYDVIEYKKRIPQITGYYWTVPKEPISEIEERLGSVEIVTGETATAPTQIEKLDFGVNLYEITKDETKVDPDLLNKLRGIDWILLKENADDVW